MNEQSAFDATRQHGGTGGKIVVALERIAEAFRVLLWNEGKAAGLSPLQVQLLIFVLHHPEEEKRKVGRLAAEFNMTKPTVSDAVKALLAKELVEKIPDPVDQRSFSLALSPAGEALARRASHFSAEIQTPIEQLPEDEQANFLLHLLGIIRHLNHAGIITVQRMCFNCAHYRPGHDGQDHFCQLMNTPLQVSELRVDCPEHEVVG
ncbi:MAG: winged helix-turn-helix transcriptional regulator [Saprospiraceae bacterium]|nr:winged helix-turn-helix transcriptional regulator [Saprospiraceae bacterium]